MRRSLLTLASILSLAACGGNGPITIMDSGVTDGGGGGTDTGGGGTDTGGGGTDTGGGGGTCGTVDATTSLPPLPAGCVPRCSGATTSAYAGCPMNATGNDCRQAALEADTMTPGVVAVGGGMTQMIDCVGCTEWQVNSCIFDECPAEFGTFAMCAGMGTPETIMTRCADEITALNGCIMTNMAAVQTCANSRASMCFSPPSGFFPGAERASFVAEPAAFQANASMVQYWYDR
jgi:hypothetical protein